MRYFPWKLWEQLNSRNDRTSEKADKAWRLNSEAYDAQLRPLLKRFSRRNQRFWNGDLHHLHDGCIVAFIIGDALGVNVQAQRPKLWRTSATIEVVEWGTRMLCKLKYDQVQAVEAKLRDGGWSSGGTVFETWGYDELTAEGPDAFRHSILFATGSELSIVFKRFSYRRQRWTSPL